MKLDENRSCFTCAHFGLCWLRIEIQRVLLRGELRMINIDSDDAPAKFADMLLTLGNACLYFKSKSKGD